MNARALADAVVVLHATFIVFVLAGGTLALWRRGFAWLHLPAVAWAAFVEFSGTICPLTPLENRLRHAAAEAGYAGDFVERYLLAAIYPAGLTPSIQIALGVVVIAVNVVVYAAVLRRWRRELTPREGRATPQSTPRSFGGQSRLGPDRGIEDEPDEEIRR